MHNSRRFGSRPDLEGAPARAWREAAHKARRWLRIFFDADHLGGQFAIGPALAVVAETEPDLRIGTLVGRTMASPHPRQGGTPSTCSGRSLRTRHRRGRVVSARIRLDGRAARGGGEPRRPLEEAIASSSSRREDPVTVEGEQYTIRTTRDTTPSRNRGRPSHRCRRQAGCGWPHGRPISSGCCLARRHHNVRRARGRPEAFDDKVALVRKSRRALRRDRVNIWSRGGGERRPRRGDPGLKEERVIRAEQWFDSPKVFHGGRSPYRRADGGAAGATASATTPTRPDRRNSLRSSPLGATDAAARRIIGGVPASIARD